MPACILPVANVACSLTNAGTGGSTGEMPLLDRRRQTFRPGQVDSFTLDVGSLKIGDLKGVTVGFPRRSKPGAADAWYLFSVEVEDVQARFVVYCNVCHCYHCVFECAAGKVALHVGSSERAHV